jgi:hypothetical protein
MNADPAVRGAEALTDIQKLNVLIAECRRAIESDHLMSAYRKLDAMGPLLAALDAHGRGPEPPSASAWHPMETAPNDETPVLAWWSQYQHEGYRIICQRSNGTWKHIANGFNVQPPTHWMPLPPSPSSEKD